MTARTLVLLRHAKAETPGDLPDFDRQLTERGAANAGAAGRWLAEQGLAPELVFCSTAVRTRQTWANAAAHLPPGAEVRFEQGLYDGGRTEVIDLIRGVGDDVRTVLIIGHNPTISDVSLLLRPYAETTGPQPEGLATSGIAVHTCPGPWSLAEPGVMPLTAEHTARA